MIMPPPQGGGAGVAGLGGWLMIMPPPQGGGAGVAGLGGCHRGHGRASGSSSPWSRRQITMPYPMAAMAVKVNHCTA